MARERVALPGKRVGTIEVLAGDVIPDGYMVCDGALLNKVDYPKLFEVIGTAWGEPDVNTFNLPDLRGRFLRGVDGVAGRDPDKASRTAANAGGNTGNAVGSVQNDTIRNITGQLRILNNGSSTYSANGVYSFTNAGNATVEFSPNRNFDNNLANFNASNQVPTGGDNRPLNANVIYIIKVI